MARGDYIFWGVMVIVIGFVITAAAASSGAPPIGGLVLFCIFLFTGIALIVGGTTGFK